MADGSVVIVGGGVAGLWVAKILIDAGIRCTIVERGPHLGGHVRNWACMANDRCQRCFCCLAEDLVRDVNASETAEVLTRRELSRVIESNGNSAKVAMKDLETGTETVADASALVLATGFEPYDPAEKILWGHGRLKGVYTLAEVDALLREDKPEDFTRGRSEMRVAFFQCVGSRDASAGANYCSQYCCKAALRMALKLRHEHPGMSVTVFYIDLQVAGKYAANLMEEAEKQSVVLRQGVPGEIVQGNDDKLEIITEHEGRNVRESFDRIILSIGQRPSSDAASLAEQLGVSLNEFGFLGPGIAGDLGINAIPRIYPAGTCTGPKDIEQTIEHAGQIAAALIADLKTGACR